MIALVTGGRDFKDKALVFKTLDGVGPDGIIEGGAEGADRLARVWAGTRGKPYAVVPAHWETKGKAAGPIRNAWMLLFKPDVLVAFPGGRGTADMVAKAKAAGLHIIHAEGV